MATKKKSVKKKTSKKVVKKTSVRKAKKPVRKSVKRPITKVSRPVQNRRLLSGPALSFLNLLFMALFIYSIYVIWTFSWSQGLMLIVLLLIIIFIMKVIRKLRR